MKVNTARLIFALIAAVVLLSGCGSGGESSEAEASEAADTTAGSTGGDSSAPVTDDGEDSRADDGAAASDGSGVILADLCADNQPLNGAITVEDLVSYGMFTSTDVVIESNAAYETAAYETFGFLCNMSEDVGDGENFLTIGMSSGSAIWDLAIEQGTAPVEQIGNWEVIVGSNWLSPLTMRTTDAAGNQDSLFTTWTPADGSIPDAATLERLMRPLAEAIATKSTVDIPRG